MKEKEIQYITFVGLVINVILSALKCSIGYLYKSQALFADGIHSLSDMVTDIIIIVGAKYWEQPADKSHPYGHKRIETLITLIIGIGLATIAIGIGCKAIINFNNPIKVSPSLSVLIVAIISILFKELLYHWTIKKGKEIKSRALISNAWHHRSDALSSIPVTIAVMGGYIMPSFLFLDHIATIIVTVMLLNAAWSIAKPALLEICETDAGSDIDLIIKNTANDISEIKEVHAIRTRKMGDAVFADLHLLVDANITVYEGHKIAAKLKKQLISSNERLIDVLIHIEPYEENRE